MNQKPDSRSIKHVQNIIRHALRRIHELDQQAAEIDEGQKGQFKTITEQILNYLDKLIAHHFFCEAGVLASHEFAERKKKCLAELHVKLNKIEPRKISCN